ncbi:MAG: nicotinamidase [Candidatus Aenigmarchaeota archaeon]|nr:nicotinamidase [Candidatus Aenigmarchaeota archaeon]
MKTLPVPPFFKPAHAAEWGFSPNQQQLADEAAKWRKQHGIRPSGSDRFKAHLLIIDAQRDFCFPQGTLYVGGRSGQGAIEDNVRTAQFIYRNLGLITDISTTFDTHFAFQIFFPWFWQDQQGNPLQAHTMIKLGGKDGSRLDNVGLDGKLLHEGVQPNPAMARWLCNGNVAWLQKQAHFYCQQLDAGGKYVLYLWPPHCLLGSDGHALAGVIHEARFFHSLCRFSQSTGEVKGGHPLTENYSVLAPEVLMRWDGRPLAQRNTAFLETLMAADAVLVAGQAASHCVKSSIADLLDQLVAKDPELAKKVFILRDCMSAVAVPDGAGGFAADFTPQAEEALEKFAAAGMNVIRSTDPVDSWLTVPA